MDWKLELVIIPVSDIDRAKAFYTDKAGFNADHDHTVSDEIRFVQLTPPGSACSIAIGKGITDAAPGSVVGLQMVVPDIEAAHDELVKRGAEVSEILTHGDLRDDPLRRTDAFGYAERQIVKVYQRGRRPRLPCREPRARKEGCRDYSRSTG